MSSVPSPRPRRLLIGGVVVPAALLGSMLCATSATAAPVTTKAELVSSIQSATSGSTVALDIDLLGDGGSSDVITLPNARSVTLDLNGHRLEVDRIAIPTSSFLTLSDSTGTGAALAVGGASVVPSDTGATGVQMARSSGIEVGGHVTLQTAGSAGRPGVGTATSTDTNAVLYADDGATVEATGGSHGAGIGGGDGAVPLGTISIGHATVTATGGTGAAAIGGGYGSTGTGSAISIENGDVTLAGSIASTFESFDNAATSGGTSTLRVASGSTLTVPSGKPFSNSGEVVVDGTLTGAGTIDNTGGTIRQGAAGTIDDTGLTVTGRNHAVSFASAGGTTTAPPVKHVYATTLAKGGLDLAAYSGSANGRPLVGWSSGSTAHVTDADPLAPLSSSGGESGPIALTAAYETPIAFSATSLPNAATGQRYDRAAPVTGDATAFAVAADTATGLPAGTIPSLPLGLSVDALSGAITGRATTAGHYSFVLTASSAHQRRSQTLTIDVAGAPVIATGELPTATFGTAYRTPILAESEQGAISYAVAGGALPGGLQLDTVTGVLAGTPTSTGTFTFTVSAANAYGTAERTLTLAVVAAGAHGGSGGTGGGSSGTVAGAPVLPIVPTTTVRLGHPLALSLAASSTLPVIYSVPAKELPPGITLDRLSGLLHGSPRTAGRSVLHVTAASDAGSTTRGYTIVVPQPTHVVTGSASTVTPRSGATVSVTIRGLRAGERWRIALDGRQVRTGVTRFGGTITRSVTLPARAKDTVHRIRVSGDRRITDPSTVASHEVKVTAVAATKSLHLTRSGGTLTARGLAANERVRITRGTTVLARGRADAKGAFVLKQKKLKAGAYVVTGSTQRRAGHLTVR